MKAFFVGEIETKWLDDGRTMEILSHAEFHDPEGNVWEVNPGDLVDGASIPRFFWRLIGSPFVGKYRRASAFHDVYCKAKKRKYKKVHAMFLEAMKCDKVGKTKRTSMYRAVTTFGPKW